MWRLKSIKTWRVLAIPSLLSFGMAAFASNEQAMILDLNLNHASQGEFAFFRRPDGDFLIEQSELSAWGLKPNLALSPEPIEGEGGSFVSLRSLGATSLAMDIQNMVLNVELPAHLFSTSAINLTASKTNNALASSEKSGFLNYRLADTSYGADTSSTALATELGLHFENSLFLNQNLFRNNAGNTRYTTQWIFDRPESQQRLVLGDFTAVSSELGSAVPMGGVNFSKVYSLAPDLVQQPLAAYSGVAESPSVVEVRVNGVPVSHSEIGAGPFELQNLRQYGGASNVQVLVRDALGREQLYSFPFYFSDQSLREGLQDYSYSLGKIRVNPGLANDGYDTTAFSAFHRFGYSDALTLGARAEAAENLSNAGLEAVWRDNQWGVLAGSASVSNHNGIGSQAAMFAYTYSQPTFGVRAVARKYDANYAPLETLHTPFNRLGDYGASFSWYPANSHSLSFDYRLTQTSDTESTRTSSINYTHSISNSNIVFATLQHTDAKSQPESVWSLFVGWVYRFGDKYTASSHINADDHGQQSTVTQFQSDMPSGEGIGYRLGWTGTQPNNTDRLNGFAQWNLPALSASVDANLLSVQGRQVDYREVALAGSIAFAGSAWGFARPINDSFAIVQLGAPVAGVHVTANSQDIGVSDANGQVISPYLGSFYESRVSIQDDSIPLDYVMGKDFYTVKPAYRSGVQVDFGLRRVRALEGVLRWRKDTQTPTADNMRVTLNRTGQTTRTFQVGKAGHFYIDNLVAGDYQGSITTAERSCRFEMHVPDLQETVITLPGDLLCE